MMISPPSTSSHSSSTRSSLISDQSLAAPLTTPPLSPSSLSSSESLVAPPITQSSALTPRDNKACTSHTISRRPLCYLHTDPQLNAELTFYDEDLIWVLCYYRKDQQVGSSLYQSKATAELLLKSLGYRPAEPKEEPA